LFSLSTHALVVLQYHHVDDTSPASTTISPEKFLQHMQLIEDLGLKVVDLESATRALLSENSTINNTKANKPSTRQVSIQVAISFDDAYSSIFENAYPELKRRNWRRRVCKYPPCQSRKSWHYDLVTNKRVG
jgi:peptidoglycan/xylan/chitin deacetylase (PgdA/CDA1 family)